MNFQEERSLRFQSWSPESSRSSAPMLSGSRSDTYGSSTTQRGFGGGLGPLVNFYHHQPAKHTSSEVSKSKTRVLDPQGRFLQRWNKIFVLACILAVSLDPLFFYTPFVKKLHETKSKCLEFDKRLAIITSVLRTFTDIFYLLHMAFQFRTGFIAPSSRVFGRGVLVKDLRAISRRYVTSYFMIDLLAVLPLPQVALMISIKNDLPSSTTKDVLKFIVIGQYVPRCARIFPLLKEVVRSAGLLTENAWAGAVLNLFLYMLASHVFGALWYLLSLGRQDECWRKAFHKESIPFEYLDCSNPKHAKEDQLSQHCGLDEQNPESFPFGIYLAALQNVAESDKFLEKFFYCFWWGLQNLSSLGQNLDTTTYVWENLFAVWIAIAGLVLFALLIGNMQTYLQSTTIRVEEMRVKRRDAEQWMAHRSLPENLRERIRRHEQYKWQETRGVNEESILSNLPKDLRRDIKRHLCLDLLKRVPMFEKMDEQLIDALLDRLKPVLYTEKSCIIREGDPVNEMLFVMRGKLSTKTTDGGRSGFFNEGTLKGGDFCGEELLTWALEPGSGTNLPTSTRTVVALKEVEAFALCSDDLKFVASQFRKLHSKKIKHTLKLYSHQWRTWAASFIQRAWQRYCKKKSEESLREEEKLLARGGGLPSLGATMLASRFATNALRALRRNGARKVRIQERMPITPLQKPPEPDFADEE